MTNEKKTRVLTLTISPADFRILLLPCEIRNKYYFRGRQLRLKFIPSNN